MFHVDSTHSSQPPLNLPSSLPQYNAFFAEITQLISRLLIEQYFFQNTAIPPELLLHLTNSLIHTIAPKQPSDVVQISREISLLWKQFQGHSLSAEEEKYLNAPPKLDVIGEVLTGIRYASLALLGKSFCSSVTDAIQNRLFTHIPAISLYFGTLSLGPKAIAYAVKHILEQAKVSPQQKTLLTPWLRCIGHLALGFVPKVHATKQGVHYHYPATEGYTQTVSQEQTTTLRGNTFSVERDGSFETPEGTFEGVYSADFTLREVSELSEERIAIHIVGPEGRSIPVLFKKIQGPFGPEIVVESEDKIIERHWASYFRPQPKQEPLALPQEIDLRQERPQPSSFYDALFCQTGIALGVVTAIALKQPLPLALTLPMCALGIGASTTPPLSPKLQSLLEEKDVPKAVNMCKTLIDSNSQTWDHPPAHLYYCQGVLFRQLGMFLAASESFAQALRHSHETFLFDAHKKMQQFITNPNDIQFRNEFLQEIGVNTPTHYESIAMSALVYELGEGEKKKQQPLSSHSFSETLCPHAENLTRKKWELGLSSMALSHSKYGYFAVSFIQKESKILIVAHRGSEISLDSLAADLDLLKTKLPDQYKEAKAFVQALEKNYPDYKIQHTGHSLGAAIAGLLAYERHENAVLADGTGIQNFIPQHYAQKKLPDVHIVTYLSATPNIVNTCLKHIGDQRAIQPRSRKEDPSLLGLALKNTGSWIWTRLWGLPAQPVVDQFDLLIEDMTESHPILGILAAFDPERGYPSSYFHVKKWPQGLQERMRYTQLQNDGSQSAHYHLKNFYQVEETTPARIQLQQFSYDAQELLSNLRNLEEIPANINPRILSLYSIEGDEITMRCHEELLTAADFHNYLESRIVQHYHRPFFAQNPFYQCCEITAQKREGQDKEAENAYRLFFELPTVKKTLTTKQRSTLQRLIQEGNRMDFVAHLQAWGPEIEKTIGNDLEQLPETELKEQNPDFDSLILNLFSSRLHLDFLSIMHESAEFFVGKLLMVNDKGIRLAYQEIVGFSLECRSMRFFLKDQSQVQIHLGENCRVDRITSNIQRQRPLLSYLSDQCEGAEFVLKLAEYGRFPEWLSPGKYRVAESIKTGLSTQRKKIVRVDTDASYFVTIMGERGKIHSVSLQAENNSIQIFDNIYHLRMHATASYEDVSSLSMTSRNLDETVIIQENYIDPQKKALARIDQLKLLLVEELQKDPDYIEEAIDDLIAQKFQSINKTSLLTSNRIGKFQSFLEEMSEIYQTIEPNMSFNVARALQEGVLEANYQRTVKFSGITEASVSEAMKLFTKSHQHILKIEGKDTVVFLAKTGSGKSTTISSLLNCNLTVVSNLAGQKSYALDPPDQPGCPKIGHALSSSETLVAQGYPNPDDKSVLFVDTPGLEETRGESFALCASLSIDQAVHLSKKLTLVITIPFASFVIDRGNGVIDLITELIQFFPDLLEEKSRASVYVLVTQHNQYTIKQFQTLLDTLLRDEQTEHRRTIWAALRILLEKDHLELTEIKAAFWKKKVRKKYSSSLALRPDQFGTFLETQQSKHEFANQIQAAASTWTRDIFQKYIALLNEKIKNYVALQEYIAEKERAQTRLKGVESSLQKIQPSRASNSADHVQTEEELKQLYQECVSNVQHDKEHFKKTEEELLALQSQQEETQQKITSLKGKIEKHIHGQESLLLREYRPGLFDKFSICTLKSGVTEEAHREGRAFTADDCEGGEYNKDVVASDYRGSLLHSFKISREYYIAPEDLEQQKLFETHDQVGSEKKYEAIVRGKFYEIQLHRRVLDSKTVTYYIQTNWDPNRHEVPWFEVTHEIPRIDYFKVSLAEWDQECAALEKEIEKIQFQIEYHQKQQKQWVDEQKKQERVCSNTEQDMLYQSFLSQQKNIVQEIADLNNRLHMIHQENKRIDREKKYIAVIVKTRLTTAEALHWFTSLVRDMEYKRRATSSMGHGGKLIETCQAYQQIYERNRQMLLQACQEDLQQNCD